MSGEQRVGNFYGDRHNIYVGWVLGMAHKHGLPFHPIHDDDGIVTDRIALDLADGVTLTLVVPPPPDDWSVLDAAEQLPVDIVFESRPQ